MNTITNTKDNTNWKPKVDDTPPLSLCERFDDVLPGGVVFTAVLFIITALTLMTGHNPPPKHTMEYWIFIHAVFGISIFSPLTVIDVFLFLLVALGHPFGKRNEVIHWAKHGWQREGFKAPREYRGSLPNLVTNEEFKRVRREVKRKNCRK